jgi:hypothetical protein
MVSELAEVMLQDTTNSKVRRGHQRRAQHSPLNVSVSDSVHYMARITSKAHLLRGSHTAEIASGHRTNTQRAGQFKRQCCSSWTGQTSSLPNLTGPYDSGRNTASSRRPRFFCRKALNTSFSRPPWEPCARLLPAIVLLLPPKSPGSQSSGHTAWISLLGDETLGL